MSAQRPAKALLGLVMSLPAVPLLQAQIQAPRPPKQEGSPSTQTLPCKAVRITQLDGDPETYRIAIRDGAHNNRPTPVEVTLGKGDSKIVESGDGTPFALSRSSVFEARSTAVTPHPVPGNLSQPLTHLWVEAGSGITIYDMVGRHPPAHDAMLAGPPNAFRDLTLQVNTECGDVIPAKGNPGDYRTPVRPV